MFKSDVKIVSPHSLVESQVKELFARYGLDVGILDDTVVPYFSLSEILLLHIAKDIACIRHHQSML